MDYTWKLDHKEKISLKDYPPDFSAKLNKVKALPVQQQFSQELGELQELCYAAGKNSILIVLQGMDTSGKDGTVRAVMADVNPQGCNVTSFKAPTIEELNHDFLWRIHQHIPAKGMIEIFNRSHYEDVLITRVRQLVPEAVWKARYDHINHFEKQLADNGTIILKFYLHISKEAQAERLKAREDDLSKRWKISAGDYKERLFWDGYQQAYDDLLEKCSTEYAPWYIVPADRKWYRNLAIAEAIVEALRPHRKDWEAGIHARGEKAYAELLQLRKEMGDKI